MASRSPKSTQGRCATDRLSQATETLPWGMWARCPIQRQCQALLMLLEVALHNNTIKMNRQEERQKSASCCGMVSNCMARLCVGSGRGGGRWRLLRWSLLGAAGAPHQTPNSIERARAPVRPHKPLPPLLRMLILSPHPHHRRPPSPPDARQELRCGGRRARCPAVAEATTRPQPQRRRGLGAPWRLRPSLGLHLVGRGGLATLCVPPPRGRVAG